MSTEISPQAARVVDAFTARSTGEVPLTQAQLEGARAQFSALAPTFRGEVLETLRDPNHPAADRAVLEGLEHGYGAYVEARRGYSGLRPGQRVGQLDLLIDRDVNISGPARGFATLADAQTAARTAARGREQDAAVFRAPDGNFVMHPISDLGRLGGGDNPQVHDLDRLGSYRLVSIATDKGLINLANDAVQVDMPFAYQVRTALRAARPITVVTGHGTVYRDGLPQAALAANGAGAGQTDDGKPAVQGTMRNSVGSGLVNGLQFSSDDMRAAVRAGTVRSQVLFVLGCNTAAYNGRPTAMGAEFLQASGARAYVGSSGFMQNGAETAAATRMLTMWRENPSMTLTQIVDRENVHMRNNRLQDAELRIVGDGSVTYDELIR